MELFKEMQIESTYSAKYVTIPFAMEKSSQGIWHDPDITTVGNMLANIALQFT